MIRSCVYHIHSSLLFSICKHVLRFHDGDNLAEGWCKNFQRIGIVPCMKIASIGTDGAYHNAKVPQKFLQRSGLPGNGVPFVWDLGKNDLFFISLKDKWFKYSGLFWIIMLFDLC